MNETTVRPAPSRIVTPALRRARIAALILAGAIAVAAALGLTVPGIYHDSAELVALLRGYDAVALVLAVPLLVSTVLRPSPRALLVWAGVLMYAIYNYAYYLFGTEINALFLVHAVVLPLAVTALILLLAALDPPAFAAGYDRRDPVRWVAGVLIVLGASLAVMWTVAMVRALATGSAVAEPSQLRVPTAFTHLGAAMDLALLVSAYLVAGVLLWRHVAWGYLLATALLVAGVLHQIAYLVAMAFQASAGIPGATGFDPVEPAILGAYVVAAAIMLRYCRAPDVTAPDHRTRSDLFANHP